ncbi:MAG: MTH1187 family thiamine-binding protein [Halobacteriota archaeon]
MTVVALLSVAPVKEGSMSEEVAKAVDALEAFDVAYETNPMGTVIETDDVDELFAAAAAAHKAVDADRVSTVLKIDDKRTVDRSAAEKVHAVESYLGRDAKGGRDVADDASR